MKLSIITPTYNRAELLKNLYNSIKKNIIENDEIEWIIIDDGSTDHTKEVIQTFESSFPIIYQYQENKGKMAALNFGMAYVTGDLLLECDSDDVLTDNAISIIKNAFEESKEEKDIYALCFLKFDQDLKNIGEKFQKNKTTMFDLYFKEGEDGEKALVYFTNIRKKYHYKIEHKEKFSTEARLHHEMDLKYKIKCFNEAIMLCEYRKDGYTKNILKIFQENPYGYYEYFKEILQLHNMKGTPFTKRLYVIKHMILFSYLTKQKIPLKETKEVINKILFIILYIPGIIKTKLKFKNGRKNEKL